MNSTNATKRALMTFHMSVLAIIAATAFMFGMACNEGREGDRCNPDLFPGEDECGGGLTCQTPSTCVESYCCPTDPTTSMNPYCNGQKCPPAPASDAGG